MKLNIDLRFVEIGYELMILTEYVELLDAHVPAIVSAEKGRIWERYDQDDEADRSTGYHVQGLLTDGVTTRFLTGAVVTGQWAIYEAAVGRLARHVQRGRSASLRMSQLRGSFLERARTYFESVLRFDLHPAGTDWQRLVQLQELRHVFAHSNGNLADVREESRERIRQWLEATDGITLRDGYIIVSVPWAKYSLGFISELLRELTARVQQAF